MMAVVDGNSARRRAKPIPHKNAALLAEVRNTYIFDQTRGLHRER